MSVIEKYFNRQILLEIFPALVFFGVNFGWGLMPATAAVMLATVAVLVIGRILDGRVPVLAVVTLILVLSLGGAGLIFNDETFIKVKPTVGSCLFGVALAIGLFFRPSFLERALGSQLTLERVGWRILTMCWIMFALCLAVLNEVIWRNMDTDTWVAVKTAMAPLSIAGYVAITHVIANRYWHEEPDASA